jgi:UDP-GlcNAc:undecaprenyl-phosphate GlcNAc-1-phosphate transferase
MPGIGSLGQGSPPLGAYGVVFATGLVVALLLTPIAQRLAHRWGMVAQPGGRRRHNGVIARTGGIPLFGGFMAALIVSQLFVRWPWETAVSSLWVVPRFDPEEVIRLTGLVLGSTVIFVSGLADDKFELPPIMIYLSQLLAAAVAILFLIFIEYVNNPFSGTQTDEFPFLLTVIITLFWIGFMTNTVNFLDGVDGLAGGVVAIACVVLLANAAFRLEPPQYSVALLPIALLGAVIGLLPFNLPPARIFLGGGAYYLGYMMGILSIIGGAKVASILLVLGLPLLDATWQILNRIARGQNPAIGDRGHFHFRLQDMGVSKGQIVAGYYLFCAVFGGLSLAIPSQLYKFVALIVLALLSVGGFMWASRNQEKPEAET